MQDTLSPFVAEACLAVMPPLPAKAMLSVENVRVCKLLGGSTADSHVVRGMVVQRDTQVCPRAQVFRRGCLGVVFLHTYLYPRVCFCVRVLSSGHGSFLPLLGAKLWFDAFIDDSLVDLACYARNETFVLHVRI